MLMEDLVVLVDENDYELGTMPKLEAHQLGRLHRAVSVFVCNADGQMLLQQRAANKYHSPGLWSNACCTHPRPSEAVLACAQRRMMEELGIHCTLQPLFVHINKADVNNGLIEHEVDHVLIGICNTTPLPNPAEIQATTFVNPKQLLADMNIHPERYTAWLHSIMPKLIEHLPQMFVNG